MYSEFFYQIYDCIFISYGYLCIPINNVFEGQFSILVKYKYQVVIMQIILLVFWLRNLCLTQRSQRFFL